MEHEEHADEHPKHSSHKHQKKNGYKVVRHVKVDHDKGKVIVKKECFWKTLTIIIGIAFVVLILALALRKPATQGGKYTGEKAKVEFYVMSQCPYGIQVENGIKPVLDKFGDAIDFQLNFIVNDNGDGTFQSLHGQNEVMGNIVQLCAAKHEPNKFMDMIFCMNKNSGAIPANWEQCAKDSGLDVAKIKTCFEGVEGKQLLSESARKTDMVGATGSPTMFIGEQDYNGGRDEVSFTRAVCQFLKDHPSCKDIPECGQDSDCTAEPTKDGKCESGKCIYSEPVPVEVIVLNDKACTNCDTTGIMSTTYQLFKGTKQKNVDVSSDEGKKLIKELEITVVPAYLFNANDVAKTAIWNEQPRLQTAFEKKGDYFKLLDQVTQATHFVDEEARKAYEQAIGLTPGDNKPQIDFFVMSYCPYGNQAEEAIEPVYQLLKDKAEFKPHYVFYSNYQGGGSSYCIDDASKYCSMHGVQEANQDIRELCVWKHMGIGKYFEFVLEMNSKCSSSNADSCWEAVANNLGLDTAKIKDCQASEALTLAEKDLVLGNTLGVSGSPTVFVEGEQYSGSRTAEGFKQALCAKFDTKPSECGQSLEGETTAVASGQC